MIIDVLDSGYFGDNPSAEFITLLHAYKSRNVVDIIIAKEDNITHWWRLLDTVENKESLYVGTPESFDKWKYSLVN